RIRLEHGRSPRLVDLGDAAFFLHPVASGRIVQAAQCLLFRDRLRLDEPRHAEAATEQLVMPAGMPRGREPSVFLGQFLPSVCLPRHDPYEGLQRRPGGDLAAGGRLLSRAGRCGLAGLSSPFRTTVPGSFEIRAALKTPVSTLAPSVL